MELKDLFESYINGQMSEADAALFEKLLKENPEYQTQFEAYRSESGGIPQPQPTAGNRIQKSRSKAASFKNWGISVAIAIVIVLAGFFLVRTLGMPPGEKLFRSYYEPMQVSDSVLNLEDPMIAKAISSYENQEYGQAAELFEKLKDGDESDLALLYLGLSQLGIDRPEKAIPILSLISQKSDYFFEATWYGSMAYLKLNKLEEAEELLLISASNPNYYSEKADEILLKMK